MRSWGRFQWTILVAALAGPPVLTALAARLDGKGGAAPALMFLGGAAGGLAGGVMLGCRFGKSATAKVVLSVLFAAISAVAVITLCGLGCAIGGYQLNFR